MAEKINHWCVVCGKGYYACDSCNETKTFSPWRTLTDSIEHFKIFTILKDYNNKIITKDEAKELLSSLNINDKESFKESSKKLIDEILKPYSNVENKTYRKKIVNTTNPQSNTNLNDNNEK